MSPTTVDTETPMDYLRRLGGGFPRPSDNDLQRIEEGSGIPTSPIPAPTPPAPLNPLSFGLPEDITTRSAHHGQAPAVHSSRVDAEGLLHTDDVASCMDVDVNAIQGTRLLPSVRIRSRPETTDGEGASEKVRIVEKADPRVKVCTPK